MSFANKLALKCGLFIGLACLAWLYVAYWIGLRTNGILVLQVYLAISLIINIVGFVLGLNIVRRVSGDSWNYLRGLGVGCLMGIVAAIVAILAQLGYWEVIHPDWPKEMAKQAREYFEMEGLPEAEVETKVEEAKQFFTLPNYIKQSAMSALTIAIILSAVIMIFIQRPFQREAEPAAAEE